MYKDPSVRFLFQTQDCRILFQKRTYNYAKKGKYVDLVEVHKRYIAVLGDPAIQTAFHSDEAQNISANYKNIVFLQSTVKLLSFAVFEHCSRKILGIDLIIIEIAYHIIEYQITFQYGIICACRHSSVRKCSKPSSCLNRGKRYTISVEDG